MPIRPPDAELSLAPRLVRDLHGQCESRACRRRTVPIRERYAPREHDDSAGFSLTLPP